MATTTRIPVGATPVASYATWDDHRAAIRLGAEASREMRRAARNRR